MGPPLGKELESLKENKLPFLMNRYIDDAYYPPTEFLLFILYAGLGKGKSAYAIKNGVEILMNIYRLKEAEAWERIKEFICFHPQQFFDKLDQIRDAGLYRSPFIIWDDAGLWLYALDWSDPFVKALGKYMNVARTRLASLILTTPTPTWIIKKLRGFPDAMNVKITKPDSSEWRRRARAYQQNMLPDMTKYRVRVVFDDYFSCKMPDDFYWKWYQPLRSEYENMALNLIKQSWEETKKNSIVPELLDYPKLALPELKPI